MTTQQYLEIVKNRFKSGISREHSYRGDLETLIRSIVKGVDITNEPANVTDCGNPDYVITKGKIPIGYIEAKDIGKDLNDKHYKEQFGRYKKALDNLIITDYIWFQFFQHGELVHEIRIAEIEGNTIKPLPDNFEQFENLIQDFCTFVGQTIKSSKKLAKMMAGKARLLQNILEHAITTDEETRDNTSLKGQYDTFKQILIHDLSPKDFADIYAQTLAYGMFAARLHDTTLDNFSRQEAAELIPKTNPFLRRLFQYIAGYDIDERIKTTVDNLAEVFRATNIEAMLQSFGKTTKTEDPIIHFYETFLAEYDPKLRKSRGVWYTPQPVVNFIVRAVDDILKTEFDLPQGLADTSKIKVKVQDVYKASADLRSKTKQIEREKEVHRVQILDPATGTGTFLAEVVRQIYSKFEGMQGIWSNYVETHLLPRLNGFELLMASYAMAHLKLDMLLADTGFKPTTNQRLKVYLTNSLEEHHPDTGTLFAHWLSTEANEANHIKRDTPVMCVIGNPPYSGESANKGDWIMNLMEDYKKEPDTKEKLKERNPKWINADEYKFIRFGQYLIEKNGFGILAFINPHSFLDNPTFRGMRWNLLKTFDKIYTLDLHGNSEKNKATTDGNLDVNVFEIKQGVSINIFVKTGKKRDNELGDVFYFDLFGKREMKYDFLIKQSLATIEYKRLSNLSPNYYFVNKDFEEQMDYEIGFRLNDLFQTNNVGIVTSKDLIFINERQNDLIKNVEDFFKIQADTNLIKPISYRPFDNKLIYYDTKRLERAREKLMQNFLIGENIGLVASRQCVGNWQYIFISKLIGEFNLTGTAGRYGAGNYFPLYCYLKNNEQQTFEYTEERTPNLNPEIVKKITESIGLTFTKEKETTENTFAPIDLLDYIYAVLHSPTYREKYKEFLKIDFPRVPYPKDQQTFWQLVKLGGELRQIHLLESPTVNKPITSYPVDGNNRVENIKTVPINETSVPDVYVRAYINSTQYFDRIPAVAWNFHIGGYQPAQKWLKDRKDRQLEFDDILHYQKIIVALTETERLMKEIDQISIE